IVLCEGWDAAGKGGSIRRLVSALDPRGYEVIPIAAPTKAELAMHYLWRFSLRLPKAGHIAVFDRTWYGRVLVERVEGFCPESKWRLAYDEIRDFEDYLVRWGYVLVKFWLHIDKDEQLRRFQAREADPNKNYKITPDDWRNREKWDAYEAAVADMLELTSTPHCPWTVIAGNDKPFARISVMQSVADAIKKRLQD
ncbi:MAG TPA: polyphosphate kinase, partial [Polyangiaceae bacterium]